MFNDVLEVRLGGREFLIEGTPIAPKEEGAIVRFAPRVWEGTALLNAHDMPRFEDSDAAVHHGFDFVKRLIKNGG